MALEPSREFPARPAGRHAGQAVPDLHVGS
jgi:hypothetical protein